MHNEEETKELLALQKRLMDERDMIGWLCTVHRNKVTYPNNPRATKTIQDQLNRASNLISLAYVWALLEEAGFNEHNKWISSQERLELKAWKHIRHTGAHAPGGRASRYRDEFGEFMNSGVGTSLLKQNCNWTANFIDLKDGMNFQFFQWTLELVKKAIAYCANNNKPA